MLWSSVVGYTLQFIAYSKFILYTEEHARMSLIVRCDLMPCRKFVKSLQRIHRTSATTRFNNYRNCFPLTNRRENGFSWVTQLLVTNSVQLPVLHYGEETWTYG